MSGDADARFASGPIRRVTAAQMLPGTADP